MSFENYSTDVFYDELFESDGKPRQAAKILIDMINSLKPGELTTRQKAAEAMLLSMGITFAVYGNEEGTEKIWPFDIIPRIVESNEWETIEKGLKQRIYA